MKLTLKERKQVKEYAKKLVENKKPLKEDEWKDREKKYPNGDTYYRIASDINEIWDDEEIITKDIYNYLMACHDVGGEELTKSVMNALGKAINKFRQDQHDDRLKPKV